MCLCVFVCLLVFPTERKEKKLVLLWDFWAGGASDLRLRVSLCF